MNKAAYIFMMAPVAGLVAQAEPMAEPRDEHGRTPLMRALAHHTMPPLEQIKALIDAGANVNAQDDFKYTALHYAAKKGHLKIAELLVNAGANLKAKDHNGVTPLQEAKLSGQEEMEEFLKSAGGH